MKNLKKAERAVIALTVLCLIFTAGYFVGRGSAVQVISFDKLTSETMSFANSPMTETTAAGGSIPVVTDSAESEAGESNTSLTPHGDPSALVSNITTGISAKININTASADTLDRLPGIGPVLAQCIIDYREKSGDFKHIEEIKDVDGIGEKKFDAMKDMISVG